MRTRAARLALLLAIAFPGCTPGPSVGPTIVGPTGSTSPSTASPATGGASSPGPSPVEVVSVEWQWRELVSMPVQGASSATPVFDGRYFVDPARSRDGSAVIVDTEGGSVAVDHRVDDADGGWATHTAFLSERWAIVTESNTLEPFEVRAYRYDLGTGERRAFAELEGLPAAGLSWSVDGGIAAFDIKYPDRRVSCLVALTIATLEWRERWCGPEGLLIGWPRLGPGGSATFRLQDEGTSELAPCARLFRLALGGDEEPHELPLREACKGFSGAGGADWTAWSEVGLRDEEIGRSAGLAEPPEGGLVALGVVQTGTITACGAWVYWQVDVPATSSERLVRWRPGQPAQAVFETPSDSLLSTQTCAAGWLTVVVAEAGATETVLSTLPPD